MKFSSSKANEGERDPTNIVKFLVSVEFDIRAVGLAIPGRVSFIRFELFEMVLFQWYHCGTTTSFGLKTFGPKQLLACAMFNRALLVSDVWR